MVCIALFTFVKIFWDARWFLYCFVSMTIEATAVQDKHLLAGLHRLNCAIVIEHFDVLDSELNFIGAVDLSVFLLVLIIFILELIYVQIRLIFYFTLLKLIFPEFIVVFD